MKRTILPLALAMMAVSVSALAQTLQYSVPLQNYGFTPQANYLEKGMRDSASTRHVAIDGQGRVYVGFAVRGDPKLLKQGEANNTFRVLTIGPEAGTVAKILDFPTSYLERVGINLSASDALLVTANEQVQLIGEDGVSKAKFDIPQGKAGWPSALANLSIYESSSAKTLLIERDYHSFYFLSSDTLSPTAQCKILSRRDMPETFTDNMQMNVFETDYTWSFELMKGEFCRETEPLRALGQRDFEPVLLNDSILLEVEAGSWTDQSSIWVEKIDGKALWSVTLPKHFFFDHYHDGIRTSRDGHNFAIVVWEERGGSQTFDISAKLVSSSIAIYDAQTGKHIGSIQGQRHFFGNFEFALSPHGDKLAILKNGILEVWKI